MSSNFPEGEYQAKATSVRVTKNRFNTECIAAEFCVTEGALAGRTVQAEYEFSNDRYQKTVETLVHLGWQKRGLAPDLLAAECTRPVTIRVRYWESKKTDRNGKPYINQAVDVSGPQASVMGGELSELEARLRKLGAMEEDDIRF